MATSTEEDSQDDGEQTQSNSDEDLQDQHKDDQQKSDTVTAKVVDGDYIPHGTVEVVNAMIKELNDTYTTIPDVSHRKAGDLYKAYYSVLRSKSLWSTKTVESHFPFKRFCQNINTVFPVDTMRVDKYRKQWSCSICPDMKPVVVSPKHKFNHQNCLKHFRSAMHCNSASAKSRAGESLHEGVLRAWSWDAYFRTRSTSIDSRRRHHILR